MTTKRRIEENYNGKTIERRIMRNAGNVRDLAPTRY